MAKRRLTNRQKARIANIQEKRRQRIAERTESAISSSDEQQAQAGRVITRHGQNLLIKPENGPPRHCLFRQNLGEVVCGDEVVWQPTHDNEGVVTALMSRRTVLSRPDYSGREKPLAANITQLVIVLAPEPKPTGYLTDQYLIAAELMGIKALITLNKADLLNQQQWHEFQDQFHHYADIGYPLIKVSARLEHGLDPLRAHLDHETSFLVGQSGVGKSSLINALIPEQEVEVGALSEASGLGRHTTSAATLHFLQSGGELIDSPGVRSFRLGALNARLPVERRQDDHPVPEVADRFDQRRVVVVADQHAQDAAHRRGVVEDRLERPQVLDDDRQPARFLEFVDAMRE